MKSTHDHLSHSRLFPSGKAHAATGCLVLATALSLTFLAGNCSATDLTMGTSDRQPIKGWGIFPGYSHSNWGAPYVSIANRPNTRDKVFELPVNFIRVELSSNSYDGTAANKLNLAAMNELKTHVLMAKGKGVNNWMVTSWSPPAPFKTPLQDTRGQVNGTVTYMNMAFKNQFCEYYANAIAYLRDSGCGTPAVISLQNEVNYVVPYDGCSFYSKADYQDLIKTMRTWLDSKGLTTVGIGAPEPAQPGDPAFLGTGTSFWADAPSLPVTDIIVHTYGGAGWDHYQFSTATLPKWVTEWSDIDGGDEMSAVMQSSAHVARDVLNDGVQYWIYWNAYNYATSPGSADLVYGVNDSPLTTKLFHVFKRLFKEVTPDGSFKVRSFTSSDSTLNTGFGSDYSKLVDVIGFKSATKTVIMLRNPSATAASIVLKGLTVSSLHRYETTATTPSSAEMDDRGNIAVSGGNTAAISIPGSSVQIFTSGGFFAETESLTVAASSGDTHRIFTDTRLSGGSGTILDANAVGDYVTYLVPNIAAGPYNVKIGVKNTTTRGTWQLAIGRADSFSTTFSNVGPVIDEYTAAEVFTEVDLGTWTPGTTSDKWFQFKITGKNASSTGYGEAFDYIRLTPQ